MEILVFGDQTADQYPFLRSITTRKESALVSAFLERVSVTLRAETRRLPRTRREQFPDFLTVGNLIQRYHEAEAKIPELESALVTLSQLSHYLG